MWCYSVANCLLSLPCWTFSPLSFIYCHISQHLPILASEQCGNVLWQHSRDQDYFYFSLLTSPKIQVYKTTYHCWILLYKLYDFILTCHIKILFFLHNVILYKQRINTNTNTTIKYWDHVDDLAYTTQRTLLHYWACASRPGGDAAENAYYYTIHIHFITYFHPKLHERFIAYTAFTATEAYIAHPVKKINFSIDCSVSLVNISRFFGLW